MHIAFVGTDHRSVPRGPEGDAYTRVCAEPRAVGNAWVRRWFSVFGVRSLWFLHAYFYLFFRITPFDLWSSRLLRFIVSVYFSY
jgi:hypothetical protein